MTLQIPPISGNPAGPVFPGRQALYLGVGLDDRPGAEETRSP
ncbi:hypothetical protein NHJ6243_005686 [Beauveria neobassiana]